ncbi:MAG: response regulator transcription factor [Flavisolibacter sp.]|nr:response regulator transcription factor [Flavisolibacter sp.]
MQPPKKIKCLIIDDEPPAREILKKHIAGVDTLELAGECANAVEALSFLRRHAVHLLFLDIQMPHILGTSFIRTLKNPPKVIFTTAFREFAVEGFELNAVDYLVKPIGFERFLQAVNRVLEINQPLSENTIQVKELVSEPSNPFLYFRVDRKMVKVYLQDILFIESQKDYIKVVTANRTIVTKQPISSLEEILPNANFLRIHRSYIVAIDKIDSFYADSVEIVKVEIPVGRTFKNDVNKLLNSK